jgi:cobyrinic acid a,c-diamide synthase
MSRASDGSTVGGVPRVVIAAPASGSGKTTVATGLLGALGPRVAPFKVGPDYIDPGYHTLAAGRPGRNLDPVLVGDDLVGPLFAHGSRGADIAVVEGVMGLFDGRATTDQGSTAHVARLLDAPVVLVVDARGQGRSLAALLHGFRGYDPTVRLAGVILNQVGSGHHETVLREAAADVGLPVLGALPRGADVALPSRHLGLVPAVEHGESARRAVAAMTELVTRSVDLEAVRRIAATAGPSTWAAWCPEDVVSRTSGEPVVAVAGGRAFTFGYAEHAELLAAAGACVRVVDPLADETLPAGTAALVLPGGFPEQHAAALSANTGLRAAVAAFARSGGIVVAACGGLLYLLDDLSGEPMCGVLPGRAELGPTLAIGYRDAVAATDSVSHRAGERRTGHEFHRTRVHTDADPAPAWFWRGRDGRAVRDGFVVGHMHASYLHTHPAAHPETVSRLVVAAGARP